MSKLPALQGAGRNGVHLGTLAGEEPLGLILDGLGRVGLARELEIDRDRQGSGARLGLSGACVRWLSPGCDTLGLAERLGLESRNDVHDLAAEITVALLLAPVPVRFRSAAHFASALRVRLELVAAAQKTRLEFMTHGAERPHHFVYDDERGFVLRPGCGLIEALEAATQPGTGGRRFSFSCWRATEHVLLLAVAREAERHHPELYARLTRQAERRALKGAAFDAAFLRAHGSAAEPIAARYFVPGDRIWFKNPDPASAQVAGFEGSYTFYLGGGEFADFWRDEHVDSFASKCLTLFYWRHGLERDAHGEPRIDEERVQALVERTLADPVETSAIVARMARVQAASDDGTGEGGCADPSRDHVRALGAPSELTLPDVDA